MENKKMNDKGIVSKIVKDMIINQEIAKKIITDKVYLNWLENFVKKHGDFDMDTYLYRENEITKIDKKRINMLFRLFEGIQQFADEVYVYSIPIECGRAYKFKYNNICYEIGIVVGQGSYCYISLIENEEDKKSAIDLLLAEEMRNKAKIIDAALDDIINVIDEKVQTFNIPKQAVLVRVKEYVKNQLVQE